MNSLNIVSRLTTPPATPPPRSRTSSSHQLHTLGSTVHDDSEGATPLMNISSLAERLGFGGGEQGNEEAEDHVRRGDFEDHDDDDGSIDEKKPDPAISNPKIEVEAQSASLWRFPGRAAEAMLYGMRVVFSTITAPVRYMIACFYDEQGRFSAILPLQSLRRLTKQRRQISTAHAVGLSSAGLEAAPDDEKSAPPRRTGSKRRSPSVSSTTSTLSAASSDGDPDDSPARHTRSRTAHGPDRDDDSAAAPPRKSIRYKEETLRKRRGTKTRSRPSADDVATVASALKSPSSPVGGSHAMKLTRYPRAPAPPRPLVPRRQPSHALLVAPPSFLGTAPTKKTLIIDLDETLIHSMAKGGRMSTGHMVEVRMSASSPMMVAQSSSPTALGLPSHPAPMATLPPILYYVHERPGCHEFLRKVCRWFRLVVFTASVQEYADPVIDWLERERKYFAGRYYRQHCTFRNGAYIKDLAQVEPDLSKVMILDNSPMSYIFHEDNAIPIEGWISDPTDNDLLHLIPLFEGLQYVTDVRALLALRQGQAQQA